METLKTFNLKYFFKIKVKIDEINTFDLKDVAVNDGQNHPLDKK